MSTFENEYNWIWKQCDYESDPELIVLKGHLVSERYIERLIKLILVKGEIIIEKGRLTYAQKLYLLDSLGFIPNDLIECHSNLNKLRNKMAHELGYEISLNDIELIGRPMGKMYSKMKKERGNDLKNLLCSVIGFICSGLAHYAVEYENISKTKKMELKKPAPKAAYK